MEEENQKTIEQTTEDNKETEGGINNQEKNSSQAPNFTNRFFHAENGDNQSSQIEEII
jgi:hypothetical protein